MWLSAVDAKHLSLSEGQKVEVIAGGAVFAAPVKISNDLAAGVVGVPVLAGLPKVASGLAVSLEGSV